MTKSRRVFSTFTALAITAASASGCMGYDTRTIMTCGDVKVASGVYINYLMSELSNQMYSMYYRNGGQQQEDILNTTIDEDGQAVLLSEHLDKYALEQTKKHVAIQLKFDEMGLTLDDDDLSGMETSLDKTWEQNSKYFENLGVSYDSMKEVYTVSLKDNAIFEAYYFKGGIEEVTDEDIQNYLSENYLRYKQVMISKTSYGEDGSSVDNSEKAKEDWDYLHEQADNNNINFEDFDQLIQEYQDMNTTPDEDATNAEDTENTDPYKNELIINYKNYPDDEKYKFILGLENNVVSYYEDDNAYYIFVKEDILKREDYIKDNHDSLVQTMKSEDFTKMLDDWVAALTFDVNAKALKRYTSTDIYNREVKYNASNK